MSKPVASISVPKDSKWRWDANLPHFINEVGPLSPSVFKYVTQFKIFDKGQLQNYVAKEGLTSRNKYLIIELD